MDITTDPLLELRRGFAATAIRLASLERLRSERQAGLRASEGKLWRDGLGTLVGMALLDVTGGASLVLAFWTSTSLIVDRLDVTTQNRALNELDAEIDTLVRHLSELERELESLSPTSTPPDAS